MTVFSPELCRTVFKKTYLVISYLKSEIINVFKAEIRPYLLFPKMLLLLNIRAVLFSKSGFKMVSYFERQSIRLLVKFQIPEPDTSVQKRLSFSRLWQKVRIRYWQSVQGHGWVTDINRDFILRLWATKRLIPRRVSGIISLFIFWLIQNLKVKSKILIVSASLLLLLVISWACREC